MQDYAQKSPLLQKIEQLKDQLESNYLRNESNEEKRRTMEIQEENYNLQKEHNERIYTLKSKIDQGTNQLDQLKKDHEYSISEQRSRYEQERQALRETYEAKIQQTREEYQATRNDLKGILN